MRKILAVALAISLLIGAILLPYARARPATPEQIEDIKNYEIRVDYIRASGDYEYGVSVGERYGFLFKLVLPILVPVVEELMGIPTPSPEHTRYLEDYYPGQFERLDGIESVTKVKPEQLIVLGLGLESSFGRGMGCTTSASAPPATVGDEVLLSWNIDLFYLLKTVLRDITSDPEFDVLEIFDMPLLFVRDIEGHNKVFCIGFPGVLELPLLNDRGLAFVSNAVPLDEEGPGLSHLELLNKAMDECTTVQEAVRILEESPRFTTSGSDLANLNYLFGDANGGIASVEATHRYFAVRYGSETGGVLAQANHHQWLDWRKTQPSWAEKKAYSMRGSWMRATRMWDLLIENKGEIDLNKVMAFTADTANGPEPGVGGINSISRHGERDSPRKAGTCMAFVIQPKERMIWFCGAHPDEAPYVKIDVGKLFEEEEGQ